MYNKIKAIVVLSIIWFPVVSIIFYVILHTLLEKEKKYMQYILPILLSILMYFTNLNYEQKLIITIIAIIISLREKLFNLKL